MMGWGWTLLVLGMCIQFFGFTKRTTANEYSDTLNIGLLNDQNNLIIFGGFWFVSGIVLIAASRIADAIIKDRNPSALEDEAVPLGGSF